ncbi:MAG: (2Fe-2S) ferredoxin domain-containing protein [Chromatiales bacterium]|nr:(2Fe-2S) ferredoxin domain-containing protein [Chromatiales bacterium]
MPKPQKHVFVCVQGRPPGHPRGSCAGERGSPAVMEEFLNQVQIRNLFDRVQVTNTGCLGPCFNGASVLVYPDGVMYGGVTREDVNAIIDEHLLGGTPVERLLMPAEVW